MNIQSITTKAVMFTFSMMAVTTLTTAQDVTNRDVTGFNKIEIGGAFTVTLVQGATEGVKVTAPAEHQKQVITTVEKGTLRIHIKGDIKNDSKMELVINFKNVNEIDCSGAISLSSSAPMKFTELELETSGASKSELDITADKLEVDISGAGSTTLKGTSKFVDLDISGAGKYKASELTADDYKIDISGVGSAEVHAANSLDVSMSGSGVVKYKGEPKIKEAISGTGKISRL